MEYIFVCVMTSGGKKRRKMYEDNSYSPDSKSVGDDQDDVHADTVDA